MPRVNRDFAQNLVAGLNYGVSENQPNYNLPINTGGNYYDGGFDNNGTADYALFELVNTYFESQPTNYSDISVPWDGILNNNIEWEIVNYEAIQSGQPAPKPINLIPGGNGYGGGLIPGTPTKYIGFPVQGDAFTKRSNGFHTFQFKLYNVTANIQILGTLDNDPNTNNYVPIYLTNTVTGQTLTTLTFSMFPQSPWYSVDTINNFYTSVGQYTWLKAAVTSFSGGLIDFIKVAF